MDFLQIALIFLILLLSIFLAITGVQVFLILRNLKKALDRLNKVLEAGSDIAQDIEKPIASAANLINTIEVGASKVLDIKKDSKPKKRFYKRTL